MIRALESAQRASGKQRQQQKGQAKIKTLFHASPFLFLQTHSPASSSAQHHEQDRNIPEFLLLDEGSLRIYIDGVFRDIG